MRLVRESTPGPCIIIITTCFESSEPSEPWRPALDVGWDDDVISSLAAIMRLRLCGLTGSSAWWLLTDIFPL